MEMVRQTDRDMNKKRDKRRDDAVRHIKATGTTALLLAPVAHSKMKLKRGRARAETREKSRV